MPKAPELPPTTKGPTPAKYELSVPWSENGSIHNIAIWDNKANHDSFVRERSEVHSLYIRETEKTKRIGYILAALLLALACVIPIFAPPAWIVSAALLVFSAGAMGYSKLWLKMKGNDLRLSKK